MAAWLFEVDVDCELLPPVRPEVDAWLLLVPERAEAPLLLLELLVPLLPLPAARAMAAAPADDTALAELAGAVAPALPPLFDLAVALAVGF